VLSRALGDRTVSGFGTKNFWQGFQIGCYTCHNGPNSEHSTSNRAPVVHNATATTDENTPVQIAMSASDADRNSLSLRIVSQPANGTVGLAGTSATYFPFTGFSGNDSFTYAAWDGSTNSNLGTVTVTVADTGGTCTVSCSSTVDTSGRVGRPASFSASAALGDCADAATFEWEFGDGNVASGADASHTFASPGVYNWLLTVTADGATCTRTDSITIDNRVLLIRHGGDRHVP
jgi:chitin-binding protein